jgi:hypothetical protein
MKPMTVGELTYWAGEIRTSIVAANEAVDEDYSEEISAFNAIISMATKNLEGK